MFFRPLEAEYFNLLEFSKLGNKVFVYKVKNMIDEAFSSEDLKHQYRKRKIYLYYNNNLEYLFTI